MKRFLLWIISVALGVVVLLAAVMGVSYAFTAEGGCPDGAAQFGGQALEPNGSCWQVPLLGGQLDKVFASPSTLSVQKLGVLYTAHPELSLPEWTCYTALTIQNAAGDVPGPAESGHEGGIPGGFRPQLMVHRRHMQQPAMPGRQKGHDA